MNFNCSILSNEPWDSLHMASACLYVAPELRKLSTKKIKQLVCINQNYVLVGFPPNQVTSHGHVKNLFGFSKKKQLVHTLNKDPF